MGKHSRVNKGFINELAKPTAGKQKAQKAFDYRNAVTKPDSIKTSNFNSRDRRKPDSNLAKEQTQEVKRKI